MTRHIMLDIETLGTNVGAPILSLGAVRFTLDDVPPLFKPDMNTARKSFLMGGNTDTDSFYRNISLTSNMRADLIEITQGSVDFWLQQPDETRLALLEHRVPLKDALSDFWKWVDAEEYEGIWAHGTTFDMPLLQEAYIATYNQDRVPWRYRSVRDTRTLFSIAFPSTKIPEPEDLVAHNALTDSYRQAKMVQACYERINMWRADGATQDSRE